MATQILKNYFAQGLKTSDIAKITNKSIGAIRHEKRKWKKVNNVIEHTGNQAVDTGEEYKKLLSDIDRLQKLGLSVTDISKKLGKTIQEIEVAVYTKELTNDLARIDCPPLTRFAIGKSLALIERDVMVLSDEMLKEFFDKLYFGKIKSPRYFGPSCRKWIQVYLYGEKGKPEEVKETSDEKESKIVTAEEDINKALPTIEQVTRSEMEKEMADLYLMKTKKVVKVISKETGVDEDTVYKVMVSYKKNFGGWI